jgi:hypothetical protein
MAIYQPPSYAPPLPPLSPDPHRETPWYRKAWFVGLIGFLLGAAIAGSMTGWVSKTKTVAGPVRVVTSIMPGPTVTETAAASTPTPPSGTGRGNVLTIGKTMNVAPPRHTFRRPDHHRSADLHQPGRPIQFGTKNGYFVTAHITVKALSS